MRNIRLKMLKGIRVPGCDKCYEEEDSNKRASLRQIYNRLDSLTKNIDPEEPR